MSPQGTASYTRSMKSHPKPLTLLIALLVIVVAGAVGGWLYVPRLPDPIGLVLKESAPVLPAVMPPPPPVPRRDPPPGWSPPVWPEIPAATGQPARLSELQPEFEQTSWDFPSFDEVQEFYWGSPLHKRFGGASAPVSSFRRFAVDCARQLAAACPDQAVARYLDALVSSKDTVMVPVLLHGIRVAGKPRWVVVSAWEIEHDAGSRFGCGHIEIAVLEPGTGKVVDTVRCG